LQAQQQDAGWPLPKVELSARTTERFSQCAVHNSNKALSGAKSAHHLIAERTGSHRFDELRCYRKCYVGIEQRPANLSESGFKVGLAYPTLPAKAL
jgi:hypothetical protein